MVPQVAALTSIEARRSVRRASDVHAWRGMLSVRHALAVLSLAVLMAACRFIVPADTQPSLPDPESSVRPKVSPTLLVPPPRD